MMETIVDVKDWNTSNDMMTMTHIPSVKHTPHVSGPLFDSRQQVQIMSK